MKNNYLMFFVHKYRGCDLIKKKTGIIKPEGEIVKRKTIHKHQNIQQQRKSRKSGKQR